MNKECKRFGNMELDAGGCIDCSIFTPKLFDRCWVETYSKRKSKKDVYSYNDD